MGFFDKIGQAASWVGNNPLSGIFPVGPFGLLGGAGAGGVSSAKGGGMPPVPDFQGLANTMAEANFRNLQYQTAANRPNITTPEGSLTWTGTGAAGDPWSMAVNRSPAEQAIFEQQQALRGGRSGLANQLLSAAGGQLGGVEPAIPQAGDTTRQRVEDALYQRVTSRLDPQWDQRREQQRSELYNQGLRPGMEAYDTRMQDFERGRTDAYQNAMNQAIAGGGAEQERGFGMEMAGYQAALARRLQAINEMNAVLSGQQAGTPQFPGFQGAGVAEAPDILGAATQTYGAQMGQRNAQQAQKAGMMNAGASALPLLLL